MIKKLTTQQRIKYSTTVYTFIILCVVMITMKSWRRNAYQILDSEEDDTFIWRSKGPLVGESHQLIQHVKESFIPPSREHYNLMINSIGSEAEEYNSYRKKFPSWIRTNHIIQRLFGDKLNGFFFEAGAMDGEFVSNTLDLEIHQGWTGVLVEADSNLNVLLRTKHRRAWSSQSCISPTNFAQKLKFNTYQDDDASNIVDRLLTRSTGALATVLSPSRGLMGKPEVPTMIQCYPLISYLLAVNASHVDLMILDVEGSEADIVLSFPWDKVDITVLHIEHRPENNKFSKKKKREYDKLKQYSDSSNIKNHKSVIILDRDPKEGRDKDFIKFMEKKNFTLLLYYDGDYTFVKSTSLLCGRYCDNPEEILDGL